MSNKPPFNIVWPTIHFGIVSKHSLYILILLLLLQQQQQPMTNTLKAKQKPHITRSSILFVCLVVALLNNCLNSPLCCKDILLILINQTKRTK